MRILVTGATGFIGRNLVNALVGNEIMALKRGDDLKIVRDFKPDKIFHLAAEKLDESKMFDSNVRLTHDLLAAVRDVDYESFVYVGSSAEYGRCSGPMNEGHPIRPTTLHEATKGCGTLLALLEAARGRPVCVVRPFSVYGGPFQPSCQFIPTLFRCHRTRETFNLAPGSHDWIHVDDFIRGLMKISDAPPEETGGEIVNLGTGINTSNEKVVETFRKVIGDVYIHRVSPMKTYDSECWVADTTLAKEKFGFFAKIGLAEGLIACAKQD